MNKTLKKFIALVLSLLMLMSVMSVAAFAQDDTSNESSVVETEGTADAETDEPADGDETESTGHGTIFQVILKMWMEFFSLLKYIFNDVFLGVAA